jgi:integrase
VLLDGPVEGSTINRELATLRRILNLAVRWKVITSAPRITLPFAERQCERVLSHEQEHEYVSAAAVPLKHFVIIILETGLRPGECLRIRWEYVHFEPAGQGRFGYVHNPLGKTKRAKRNVPLTSKAKAILEMRWEMAGRPKSGWVFADESGETCMSYDVLDSAHDRLMLVYPPEKRFRLYDLRHTLLTRLGESGSNVFAIQNVAGHADLKTTGRYVHPTPEHIEDAFSRLDAYNRRKHVEREEASSSAAARLN